MDWLQWWGMAAAAWRDHLAHVTDPLVRTPAGEWTVRDLVSRIESEGRSLAPDGSVADLPMDSTTRRWPFDGDS